jgi:hypothetical protein
MFYVTGGRKTVEVPGPDEPPFLRFLGYLRGQPSTKALVHTCFYHISSQLQYHSGSSWASILFRIQFDLTLFRLDSRK